MDVLPIDPVSTPSPGKEKLDHFHGFSQKTRLIKSGTTKVEVDFAHAQFEKQE